MKDTLLTPLLFTLPVLVGETTAGKASSSLAQHIPGPGGMEGMKGAASGVMGDLARARIALDERGQKLGELEDRTAAMMNSADSFSKHAHGVSTWLCRLVVAITLSLSHSLSLSLTLSVLLFLGLISKTWRFICHNIWRFI